MTLHLPTIASASASRTRPANRIWIVLQDSKHGTSCEHFFSIEDRDDWVLDWCKAYWTAERGSMPASWQDAYALLSDSLEDFLICPDPIDLNLHPSMAVVALGERAEATMLAALRLWQRIAFQVPLAESDIATNAGKFDRLSIHQINDIRRHHGGAE